MKSKAITRAFAVVTLTGALALTGFAPAAHAAGTPTVSLTGYLGGIIANDAPGASTTMILSGDTVASSHPLTFTNLTCTYYGLTPYGYLATCPHPVKGWHS
jgi:hypothetical protein